jgi:hypothetical protein
MSLEPRGGRVSGIASLTDQLLAGQSSAIREGEPADKPGSVLDNHSSGTHVAVRLKRPTRKRAQVRRCGVATATSLFGLAPGGVCRAVGVTTNAVRSYRTLSPLPAPFPVLRRFTFCCTFRGLAPPRRYLAPRPAEPGLSSTPCGAAIAWPALHRRRYGVYVGSAPLSRASRRACS